MPPHFSLLFVLPVPCLFYSLPHLELILACSKSLLQPGAAFSRQHSLAPPNPAPLLGLLHPTPPPCWACSTLSHSLVGLAPPHPAPLLGLLHHFPCPGIWDSDKNPSASGMPCASCPRLSLNGMKGNWGCPARSGVGHRW